MVKAFDVVASAKGDRLNCPENSLGSRLVSGKCFTEMPEVHIF